MTRIIAGVLLLASCLTVTADTVQSHRPNILLIVSDDQGWADLGCIGSKPIATPHLDRLASRGVRATNFYVTWPACTPSRSSILTGRYPQRNGLYDMIRNDMVNYGHRYTPDEYALSPEMTLGLDVREVTLGDVLRRAGYATATVGKWDMGQAQRFLPLQRGFDFFYGIGNNGIDYFTHERYGIPSMFRGNHRVADDKGIYATDVFRREAIRFIRESQSRPWFLYLCFNAPHGASSFASDDPADKTHTGVQAPESFVAPYRNKGIPERIARYYGAVTCMDAAIGEILAEVGEQGTTQNTLVIFMSDNGGSGNGGNAPLRGQKSTLWEGGLRVPLLACWPGRLPEGRVNNEFLTSLELLPSLLAAAGADPPRDVTLDGFDMIPTLTGDKPSPRREMFWQRRSDKAARAGNWKWVESEKGNGLFDLATDPGETKDLSQEKPDVLARVKSRWTNWRHEMDACEARGPFRDF